MEESFFVKKKLFLNVKIYKEIEYFEDSLRILTYEEEKEEM